MKNKDYDISEDFKIWENKNGEQDKWCNVFIAYSLEQAGYPLPSHTGNMTLDNLNKNWYNINSGWTIDKLLRKGD